jgi:hypothetical protein
LGGPDETRARGNGLPACVCETAYAYFPEDGAVAGVWPGIWGAPDDPWRSSILSREGYHVVPYERGCDQRPSRFQDRDPEAINRQSRFNFGTRTLYFAYENACKVVAIDPEAACLSSRPHEGDRCGFLQRGVWSTLIYQQLPSWVDGPHTPLSGYWDDGTSRQLPDTFRPRP